MPSSRRAPLAGVDRGKIEAHVGQTAAQQSRWRVLRAVPEYFRWPRRLRQMYVMLATHGSSEGALKDMCGVFGWGWDETQGMIAEEEGFLGRLLEYRESGEYPRGVGSNGQPWKNALTHEQLSIVFAEEARFEALAKLMSQDVKGAGIAQHLRDLVGNAGFMEVTDSVGERAEVQASVGEKVSGLVYDKDDHALVKANEPQVIGLADDWDWGQPGEEDIEELDAVYTASEAEGDASIEGAGEVGAGGSERR